MRVNFLLVPSIPVFHWVLSLVPLFLVYINDLPDNVLSQLATHADDSSLYCTSADSLNTTRNEVGVRLHND